MIASIPRLARRPRATADLGLLRTFGGGAERMMAYGCAPRDRGSAVCSVTVYESKGEVEAAVIDQLQTYASASRRTRW